METTFFQINVPLLCPTYLALLSPNSDVEIRASPLAKLLRTCRMCIVHLLLRVTSQLITSASFLLGNWSRVVVDQGCDKQERIPEK